MRDRIKNVKVSDLIPRSQWLRQTLLEMVVKHEAGHIPSCYSMAEIVISLYYGGVANIIRNAPDDPSRDRVFVSKGHASMGLYPVLADFGFFPKEELDRFTEFGGLLGLYADFRIPGIEGVAGSLGHGIGLGAGVSLTARKNGLSNRSFVIVGDGECYEGSIWESALFAAHNKLDNLVVIVDRNQLCMLGRTEDLMALGDLEGRWRNHGFEATTVNGHSYSSLMSAFARIGHTDGKPYAIIANTVKGKGISFMEGEALWHNRMLSAEQTEQARRDLAVNCIVD